MERRSTWAAAACLLVAGAFMPVRADWVTATVRVGRNPHAVAVNPVTNNIYVADTANRDITVIDGVPIR